MRQAWAITLKNILHAFYKYQTKLIWWKYCSLSLKAWIEILSQKGLSTQCKDFIRPSLFIVYLRVANFLGLLSAMIDSIIKLVGKRTDCSQPRGQQISIQFSAEILRNKLPDYIRISLNYLAIRPTFKQQKRLQPQAWAS